MSPSAKKRPQNSVVFKVGLGTRSRRVLTKSPTTPEQVEGKGVLRGEGGQELEWSPEFCPQTEVTKLSVWG